MEIQKFQRKPFSVDGVCVTDENMEDVAAWCLGTVVKDNSKARYIRVDAHRPLTERQTQAYPGDWILFHNRGFKVYTEAAFTRNFELIEAGTGSDHTEFVRETDIPIPEIDCVILMHDETEFARFNVKS